MSFDGAEIRHERGEVGPPVDRSDEDRLAGTPRSSSSRRRRPISPQRTTWSAAVAKRCLVRLAGDGEDDRPRALAARRPRRRAPAGLRRPPESRPAPSDGSSVMPIGQASAPRARGVQIARSPPSRMNCTILRTFSSSANSSSTSASRSFSVPSGAEQRAIGAPQPVDRLARKAVARQADDVEAAEAGAVADRRAERDDVVLHARHAAHEAVLADAHELMHGGEAAEDDVVADAAMAGERRVVHQRDVVAEHAVMRDMRADEEQAVVADARDEPAALRARIDRDVLADRAVAADLQPARLAVIFSVLRRQADAGEGKYLRAGADRRGAADDDVAVQPHACRRAATPAETMQ